MNIKQFIQGFIDFCLINPIEEKSYQTLLEKLDQLIVLIPLVSFEFDDSEYPGSPERNYDHIATQIKTRFPDLGYYNCVLDIAENLAETDVAMGDSTDDLTDIILDLRTVLWCYNNTSEADALWNLEHSYKSHWGLHARNLQLYLHSCL